jgi:hypothetical protein
MNANATVGEIQTSATMSVTVTGETARLLGFLARHGLFGSTSEDVAERLLCEKLREIVKEGWVGYIGVSGRTEPVIKL